MKSILQHELHISPAGAQALVWQVLQAGHELSDGQPVAKRPDYDSNGDELPKMTMHGNTAVIPISGPLLHGATGSEKRRFGVGSYEDVIEDIDTAKAKGATAFLFNMSSPGGTALGCPETAQAIADLSATYPTASFNGSVCCSAAEYLTAAVGIRMASPSSINGSIGTVMTVWNFEKMLEKFGVNVEIFASGKFKAAGHPAKALTDEQRDFFKGFVSHSAGEFKGWISKHRTAVKAESMEGQVFHGTEAFQRGFVDALVPSLSTAIRLIS